ncbi:MAG: hypothetical protein JWQ21_423 [Herminiimonas sp.]|nr:hypothetical protein [Herminiimonas sp.]
MKKTKTMFAQVGIFALAVFSQAFAAAPPPQYVQFSPSATKGALYMPDPAAARRSGVGIVVMHRNSNFLSHISTQELPKRGITVLAMNPRCDNNEAACAPWENNALDVKSGVDFLKKQPGITKVVLLGHSGGGPTMSFYQAVAEQGASFCQQPTKLIKCSNSLTGLTPVDGIILMDAHPGNGVNAVRSLNPAVTNDPAVLNQNQQPHVNDRLDPFSTYNGFNPDGSSNYSEDFKKRYFKGQSDRMNFLINEALAKLRVIEAEGLGDAPFIVPLGDNARLSAGDLSIHHSTVQPRKLLKNDGTIEARNPVQSVRVSQLKAEDGKGFGATMFLTVKSFLSVRAIRSKDSMDSIDWCSSNNSTVCNLQSVTVPLLVTAMGAHYFIRDSEVFFDMAASRDKDFFVIEGATHGGTRCTACEKIPGQYSNATKNLFDLMQNWINARF